MTGCLRDRMLLSLYYGGGTSVKRTHLTECEACATRYRQLGRDLEAISQVLREKSPPKTVSHRFRPFTVRWLPIGAALALALVLVWVSVRIWNLSAWPPLKGINNGETWSLVDQFPSNLFFAERGHCRGARDWECSLLQSGCCGSGGRAALRMVRPAGDGHGGILDGGFRNFRRLCLLLPVWNLTRSQEE